MNRATISRPSAAESLRRRRKRETFSTYFWTRPAGVKSSPARKQPRVGKEDREERKSAHVDENDGPGDTREEKKVGSRA